MIYIVIKPGIATFVEQHCVRDIAHISPPCDNISFISLVVPKAHGLLCMPMWPL